MLLRRSQVFVHQRNIRADGFRSLAEGEPVEFEIREDSRSGKVHASRRQLFRLPALQASQPDLTALVLLPPAVRVRVSSG